MKEEWAEIYGYKYRYRVNREGDVQRHDQKRGWVPVAACMRGTLMVSLRTVDGKQKHVPISRLVWDHFVGGRKPGTVLTYRNGARTDCSLWNLVEMPKRERYLGNRYRSRPVAKVDLEGNCLEFYGSITDAARANYMSRSAVQRRATGEVVLETQYDGFTFIYEDGKAGRPKNRRR